MTLKEFCLSPGLDLVQSGLGLDLRGPPLKGGHGEQSHHSHQDVIEVKVAVLPEPLSDRGQVHVPVFVDHESPSEKNPPEPEEFRFMNIKINPLVSGAEHTCTALECFWPRLCSDRIYPGTEQKDSSEASAQAGPGAFLKWTSSLADLEELDSDAGEHELQQRGDNHDVPDGSDGHEHTLHHVLQHKHTTDSRALWY